MGIRSTAVGISATVVDFDPTAVPWPTTVVAVFEATGLAGSSPAGGQRARRACDAIMSRAASSPSAAITAGEVVETRRIDSPADLLGLLPVGLAEPFTTADIAAATGRSRRLAMRTAHCLERCGATARLARQGRLVAYGRAPGMPDAAA